MNKKRISLRSILLGAGTALIVASVLMIVFWQFSNNQSMEKMEEYISVIHSTIPEAEHMPVEEKSNNSMPVLSIDGEDFAGVLEFPSYNARYPIGALWRNNGRYPCIYSGSVYDRSITIGTSNKKGQLDFVKEICVGDTVYFTDMTADKFSYEVTDIRYSDLSFEDSIDLREDDLTVFVRNIYAFEYIIIHCKTQ